MKLTNKVHRLASIIAAVLLILSVVYGLVTNVTNWARNLSNGIGFSVMAISVFVFLLTTVATVCGIIALLRGKKDTLAGVLFLLALGIQVLTNIMDLISLLSMVRAFMVNKQYGYLVVSRVVYQVRDMIGLVFYLLLALECFKPGKLSTTGAKWLLILAPVVMALFAVLNTVVTLMPSLSMGGSAAVTTLVTVLVGSLFGVLISHVPMVLEGVAFSIPVYEQ